MGAMPALERLLGSGPRTKVAEALIRLGETKVSRAEIAREARLFRTSTNRVINDFVSEGIIRQLSDGTRPLYQANLDSPYLLLLARFNAALELVDLTSADNGSSHSPASAHAAALEFSQAIGRILGTVVSGTGLNVASSETPTTIVTIPGTPFPKVMIQ
jgi:hypothetical protein